MADDARTEARLWFIQALVDHRLVGERCKCGSNAYPARDHELHVADALLALFPTVSWSTLSWDRYLFLATCFGTSAPASFGPTSPSGNWIWPHP